jgi:hypothetical protein
MSRRFGRWRDQRHGGRRRGCVGRIVEGEVVGGGKIGVAAVGIVVVAGIAGRRDFGDEGRGSEERLGPCGRIYDGDMDDWNVDMCRLKIWR